MSSKGPVQLYMSKLKRHMVLPQKKRQGFLEGILQEMREYTEEHVPCTYEHLVDTFGEPGCVARHFIEQSDSAELEYRTKRRRMAFRVMMGILLVLFICLAILVSVLLRHTEVRVTETITESYRKNEHANFTKEL